jgi:hypothetical protein
MTSKRTKPRRRKRSHLRVTINPRPDSDIPFEIPPDLPPGVHVAPFLREDGAPLLLVIDDKGEEVLVVEFVEVRARQHEARAYEFPFVTPQWLGEVARPWRRGVWRSPFTLHGGRQYIAVDSHGRLVRVEYIAPHGRSYSEVKDEATAVASLRAVLRAKDPVARPRRREVSHA